MGEFNSDGCGQESLRRKGVAIIVNKSPKCSTWVKFQKQQNDLSSFPRQAIQGCKPGSVMKILREQKDRPCHQGREETGAR